MATRYAFVAVIPLTSNNIFSQERSQALGADSPRSWLGGPFPTMCYPELETEVDIAIVKSNTHGKSSLP